MHSDKIVDRLRWLQELVSSLQLVFMNNLEISPKARRAVHNLTSAYTDLFEVPETDRSVAQVPKSSDFPWLS